jgi:L-malate glycosyltransferase
MPTLESSLEGKPSIFIAHPSGLLTDHVPNGDGLIAYGFISRLAARGYELHVAIDQVSLRNPLPENVKLYPLDVKSRHAALHLLEYSVRMRLLFERLRKKHHFGVVLQMNPVYPGISLALLGVKTPIILGTYVPRWGFESAGFQDGYKRRSETGMTAKLRNLVASVQQAHADALLLTSPAAGNRLPRIGMDSPKIFLVPHGIDIETFSPEREGIVGVAKDPYSILFLASVTERKGIFDLLEAFPRVLSIFPDAKLSIVGPGDDIERVKERVAGMACRERISFVGRVTRDEAAILYRKHAVYCLPSYGEPWATTLLEAMASGLPIVSTSSGGTPYIVPPDGGRLVPPGDANALAEAFIEILGSRALQQSMSEKNRRVALEQYAWDKVIDRLEAVYFAVSNGVIGRPPSRVEPAELTAAR